MSLFLQRYSKPDSAHTPRQRRHTAVYKTCKTVSAQYVFSLYSSIFSVCPLCTWNYVAPSGTVNKTGSCNCVFPLFITDMHIEPQTNRYEMSLRVFISNLSFTRQLHRNIIQRTLLDKVSICRASFYNTECLKFDCFNKNLRLAVLKDAITHTYLSEDHPATPTLTTAKDQALSFQAVLRQP